MYDDVIATWSRSEILLPAGLGILSMVLWYIPGVKLLFSPFQVFNTFIHEFCHGFVALLTGGGFRYVRVNQNFEGGATIRGGNVGITATAGYLGSVLAGALFIQLPTARMPAALTLIWIGITLIVLTVIFVRNLFGLLSGIGLSVALIAAGQILDDATARWLLVIFAIQMPLVALHSLLILVRLSLRPPRPDGLNDAQQMHKITGIPAVIWALLWLVLGVAIILVAVTLAYRYR